MRPDLVVPSEDDDVEQLIQWTQGLLLKHPVAAQAAFRALVAEGRRFAATDEGAVWRRRLEASPLLPRLRSLWEAASFNALDADGTELLPALLIDLVAQALSRSDLEEVTVRVTELAAVHR